jgi:hypothetical protein
MKSDPRSLGRLLREKLPNEMAFPHPQSRKHHYWEKDEPGRRRVIRDDVERTVNVPGDRNGTDDVNPANDQTLFHIRLPLVQRLCHSSKGWMVETTRRSFPRKRESSFRLMPNWVPAFAEASECASNQALTRSAPKPAPAVQGIFATHTWRLDNSAADRCENPSAPCANACLRAKA